MDTEENRAIVKRGKPSQIYMDSEENLETVKRRRPPMEDKEAAAADDDVNNLGEEDGDSVMVSEEMQLEIARIHEKIERFTQLVSELLESGKSMLRDLSNEFEERIISMHKDQMEKWQEEIKELQLIDGSNQEAYAVLENAKNLFLNLQNVS